MIDGHGGRKQIGAVTVFANGSRLNMRRIFAGGFHAVVTTGAVASDIQMIKVRRQPANGAVTVVAGVATRYMRRIFACGDNAVVAGSAVADDLVVIDENWEFRVTRADDRRIITLELKVLQ